MMMRFLCVVAVLSAMSSACAQDRELKVMSFNIRYGTAFDGDNSWGHRRELLVETVKAYEPDVLGLQECLGFQADYIDQALPGYRWIGIGREKDLEGEMTPIFYKGKSLAPMASGHFWLSESPSVPGSVSWDSSLTRMASWIRFRNRKSGTEFTIFNTHFDHRGSVAREKSAELLASRVTEVCAKTPVIVMGDFNAVAEKSVPWKVFNGAGLKDTWLEALEREGPETTWSGFKAPRSDSGKRIDWVLCCGSLQVLHCETVVYNDAGRYPSDHFPVFARLKLEP